MIFTDPPYGVAIGDKNKVLHSVQKAGRIEDNIANDTLPVYDHLPVPTLVTLTHVLFDSPRNMTDLEKLRAATFPEDYDPMKVDVTFLTGMCVPPVMTAQIAHQIKEQLFV